MGTLTTIDGIKWRIQSLNGRAAFRYHCHAIHFDTHSRLYHLKEKGETVFVARTSSECLEVASFYIWDHAASQITPSWERS
jgi:hypothetical protein